MVRIEKLISYLSSEKNNEDLLGEEMLFRDKFNRREESNYVSPTCDVKNISYPTKNRRTPAFYRGIQKNGYQYKKSNLHYSFTADSLYDDEKNQEVSNTTGMTVVKRNKSTKSFFTSITRKFLSSKRSSISRKYSNIYSSGKFSSKQKNSKYLNTTINKNITNIPMQVIETLYTISFTKHSYYIQRSLRRSTMIVNLITRFRSNYEELREIDVPKLKRRISFKKRVPNNKLVKKADQPREGSLIDLREQRKAKYYAIFGNTLPYNDNYSYNDYSSTYESSMDTVNTDTANTVETMNENTTVPSKSHISPRRRKKMPRKPLLEFSECETLPSIPASAAGSKVNQYLSNHKEERKKLKPIKSIDKELCLIFNKEYIPEDQINSKNENEHVTKLNRGSSLENLRSTVKQQTASPIHTKHSSFTTLPPLPSYEEPEGPSEIDPEASIFIDDEIEEKEKKPETIPSPSSATTEVYIPEEEKEETKKERKRISEGTLYNEALDVKHPGNISAESDSSDTTLKDEEINILNNDPSFIVVDESEREVNFQIDSSEESDLSDSSEEEKQSFMLTLDDGYYRKSNDIKNNYKDSFSLKDSFLLNDNIPEHMSNFLLNKTHISEDDDFINDSISILNNSIINEPFTLSLNQYGDENKSLIKNNLKIDTNPSSLENDEKPLNRIDSGVDLSGMDNICYLMANQCQI